MGRYEIQTSWATVMRPSYFSWFDAAKWRMFRQSGYDATWLMNEHGIYLPLAEVRAQFKRPSFLGDDLVLESRVAEWRDKRFLVHYVISRGEEAVH